MKQGNEKWKKSEQRLTILRPNSGNSAIKGVSLRLTNADLPEKPKRKRPYHTVKTVKRAPKGESIEKRPAEVDTREDLLVLTERKSRLPIMELMPDRTAESVVAALDRIERRFGSRLFRLIFRTITVDNGREFADVEQLEPSALTKGKRTAQRFTIASHTAVTSGEAMKTKIK